MVDGGDRVNFVDDERLDKPDTLALSSMAFEYVNRVLSAIMGPCKGTLTPISFDTTNVAAVAIGECMLLHVEESGTQLATGTVLHHNPALSNQISTVDASPYSVGTDNPYLWAKRITLEMDQASRRKWDTGVGDDISTPVNTRVRERVSWGLGNAAPDATGGWFEVARITSWTAGKPNFTSFHPFDLNKTGTIDDASADTNLSAQNARYLISSLAGSNRAGIALAFQRVIDRLNDLVGGDPAGWDLYSMASGVFDILDVIERRKASRPFLAPTAMAQNVGVWGISSSTGAAQTTDIADELVGMMPSNNHYFAQSIVPAPPKRFRVSVTPGSTLSVNMEIRRIDLGASPISSSLEVTDQWAQGSGYDQRTFTVEQSPGVGYSGQMAWLVRFYTSGTGGGSNAAIYGVEDVTEVTE